MQKKEISFKKAFQELEVLTQEFEAGEVDLETSIKKFEKALELSQICKTKLKEIENEIIEIKEKYEGTNDSV
jgi:exodeoxyribonuclease VII small subunit